jgi:3',5'-cyclic AMP phosphodiesterase CpdA
MDRDAAAPRLVIHLSDLHFGREDRRVVRALCNAVWTLRPHVVAVSGDLTQRARAAQFHRARMFLDALPRPQVVVPGNHDVPLFNLAARMFYPLSGYLSHITRDLDPLIVEGPLWVRGINTVRPAAWKSGGIEAEALERLRHSIRTAPPQLIKILVAHHPFEAPRRDPGASEPLSSLISAGIDIFLTGHLHASYTGHTAHRYNAHGRTAVVVEAGTATSTRLRAEANAFNVLRIAPNAIEVELQMFDGTGFAPVGSQRFSRADNGWSPEGTNVAE